MKKFITTLCAAAIVAPLGFAAAPAFAESVGTYYAPGAIEVQSRRDHRGGKFERRGRNHYYNGRRGYSHRRPGYRQYNGFWFPPAAFALGAIINGAINNSAPRYRSGHSRSHVEWCYDRYRSYRASDNTFQPYHGGRKQCYSPYS